LRKLSSYQLVGLQAKITTYVRGDISLLQLDEWVSSRRWGPEPIRSDPDKNRELNRSVKEWMLAHPLPMAYIPEEEARAFEEQRKAELGIVGMFDGADPEEIEALQTAMAVKGRIAVFREVQQANLADERVLRQSLERLVQFGYQGFQKGLDDDPLTRTQRKMWEQSLAE
jgi:hypothetical protein